MVPMIRRFRNWDEPLDLMRRNWDPWFEQMFPESDRVSGYPVDIREEDGNIEVEAEMPGFDKEDIDIDVEDDMLHIRAERKEEKKKGKAHLKERRYSSMERRFRLPAPVNASKVQAKLDSGVLYLTLPETESPKTKRIEIQ